MSTSHKNSTEIELRTVEPLRREHMPTQFDISLDRYIGRNGIGGGYSDGEARIPSRFGPQQSMSGFEQCYANIIDYIVRITYRIWEELDIEYIGATYSPNSNVFDDYGLQYGNKKIIADTYHTTGAFSNIRLVADEVVWAGNDTVGFHTSHRTLIRGTNDGASKYGPATGKDVDVLVIANCVAIKNEIFMEHVLYNNSSLVQQLGMNLKETATKMVKETPAGWPRSDSVWEALRHAAKPSTPIHVQEPVAGFDVDKFSRDLFEGIWNTRSFKDLDNFYRPDFEFSGASDRQFSGFDSYAQFIDSLYQCFSGLSIVVDEVYWMGNERDGFTTSVRWSASAQHDGEGQYGTATHSQIQIWGITQHCISDGVVTREWTLFNELDLMMQIEAARG